MSVRTAQKVSKKRGESAEKFRKRKGVCRFCVIVPRSAQRGCCDRCAAVSSAAVRFRSLAAVVPSAAQRQLFSDVCMTAAAGTFPPFRPCRSCLRAELFHLPHPTIPLFPSLLPLLIFLSPRFCVDFCLFPVTNDIHYDLHSEKASCGVTSPAESAIYLLFPRLLSSISGKRR